MILKFLVFGAATLSASSEFVARLLAAFADRDSTIYRDMLKNAAESAISDLTEALSLRQPSTLVLVYIDHLPLDLFKAIFADINVSFVKRRSETRSLGAVGEGEERLVTCGGDS